MGFFLFMVLISRIQEGFDFFLVFLKLQLDRFIPNRSAMDFDFAHYMLNGGKVTRETDSSTNSPCCSPSKKAYRKHLADIFNMNRTRILAFSNKPPSSVEKSFEEPAFLPKKPVKRRRIPQVSFFFFFFKWWIWLVVFFKLVIS